MGLKMKGESSKVKGKKKINHWRLNSLIAQWVRQFPMGWSILSRCNMQVSEKKLRFPFSFDLLPIARGLVDCRPSDAMSYSKIQRPVKLTALLCAFLLLQVHVGCDSGKTGADRKEDAQVTKEEAAIPSKGRPERRTRPSDGSEEARIFSEEARKAGLDKEPEVKASLERVRNEILARYFIRKHIDEQAYPSEEEVREYYLEHKDEFVVPEGVFLQHVVVKNEDQAEEVLGALKQGTPFETLAKEKSICRCWDEGGRHGWLFKGNMDPELEKAAFHLDRGEISDIIRTTDNYQIIKVLDQRDKREITFEEAKKNIWSRLFSKRKREVIDRFYAEAKVNANPAEKGVLAKVGDELVMEETVAPVLAKLSGKEKAMTLERWKNYLIETAVFSKEAKKIHLEKDPGVAKELKTRIDQTLARAFTKEFIIDGINVTDEDIEDYYRSHQGEFRIPLRVRARSILAKTREEAEIILKEIREGASFFDLAVKRSVHPAASRAGELGWFGKGEKDPALEKVAFSLEKGEISDVIKTGAGYEIIRIMNKKGGGIKPLDEVRQAIDIRLRTQRVDAEKQRYFKRAKGGS